jgi:hypothetical protein
MSDDVNVKDNAINTVYDAKIQAAAELVSDKQNNLPAQTVQGNIKYALNIANESSNDISLTELTGLKVDTAKAEVLLEQSGQKVPDALKAAVSEVAGFNPAMSGDLGAEDAQVTGVKNKMGVSDKDRIAEIVASLKAAGAELNAGDHALPASSQPTPTAKGAPAKNAQVGG